MNKHESHLYEFDVTEPEPPSKRLLHAACGTATSADIPVLEFRDYTETRLDLDPECKPDVVGDIRDLHVGMFGSVFDAVYCSHALEHLHEFEIPKALRSFYRVLDPDGLLVVMVPDFRAACRAIADGNSNALYMSPAGPIYAQDMIFGHRGMSAKSPFMQHKCGFTPDFLVGCLLGAGFRCVQLSTDSYHNLTAVGKLL